jgi:UDP-glucose 4-epimerase
MTITGDGEQTRDFVHARDIADALYKASTNELVGHGEVFNVGSGRNATINEIAQMIGGPVEYIPPRIEPRHTRADIALIQKALGWQPTVKLEDGIAELKKQFGIV